MGAKGPAATPTYLTLERIYLLKYEIYIPLNKLFSQTGWIVGGWLVGWLGESSHKTISTFCMAIICFLFPQRLPQELATPTRLSAWFYFSFFNNLSRATHSSTCCCCCCCQCVVLLSFLRHWQWHKHWQVLGAPAMSTWPRPHTCKVDYVLARLNGSIVLISLCWHFVCPSRRRARIVMSRLSFRLRPCGYRWHCSCQPFVVVAGVCVLPST